MTDRRTPQLSLRKQPRQARSTGLVAAILEAAVQVLATEGMPRFTMARVAERAGVSVGSLYQYFPNKAALLFKLQSDEWRQTTALLKSILKNAELAPLQRLRALVRAFLHSECEEAEMRIALHDAAPFYRHAPEVQDTRASGWCTFKDFVDEVLPDRSEDVRALAADLVATTLSTVGKRFSESPRTGAEIEAYADALADMLCAYFSDLARQ